MKTLYENSKDLPISLNNYHFYCMNKSEIYYKELIWKLIILIQIYTIYQKERKYVFNILCRQSISNKENNKIISWLKNYLHITFDMIDHRRIK